MQVHLVSLFPPIFDSFLATGLIQRALEAGHLSVNRVDPRAFATDKHHTVDDTPYGGGSGMVLMPGPVVAAVESIPTPTHRVLLTPQGQPFTQAHASRFAALSSLTLVCGRYEGFDERIRTVIDEEISLGDFVLLGGEVAAMAVIEAAVRLIPGVLGNDASVCEESHSEGLLEYPQYTRPPVFRGIEVPTVLRSGDHGAVARYRRKESIRRTRTRRPELLAHVELTELDRELLDELEREES